MSCFSTLAWCGEALKMRAMGHINRLKAIKCEHPERVYGICGCMAQRDAAALFEMAPHIDLVMGTRAIPKLSALIDHVMERREQIACVEECEEPYHAERTCQYAIVPCAHWSILFMAATTGARTALSHPFGGARKAVRSEP